MYSENCFLNVSLENKNFSIKNLDDIIRCINLASMLEISGYPKPGNVHRTRNFKDTRFEHFLASIAAIQPNFRKFCENIYSNTTKNTTDFSYVNLGLFFKDAVKTMIAWQKGGNVLLGHILLLAPLSAATVICLKLERLTFKDFRFFIRKIIIDSTVQDTIHLYEAIRICNPGGLGTIKKYDVYDINSINDIQTDKVNLKRIFELSMEYDSISREYATNFHIILEEGLPYFFETFDEKKDINITIVNTFLKILSEHLDTLITRKSGTDASIIVSKKASEIIKHGGISSEKGSQLTYELDEFLHHKAGRMNPGTTADLVAGVIFCALLFDLKF